VDGGALSVASQYALPGYGNRRVWVRGLGWPDHCQRKADVQHTAGGGTSVEERHLAMEEKKILLEEKRLEEQRWKREQQQEQQRMLYALAGHPWLCSHAPLSWTLGPTVRGAHELWPSIMQ